MPRNATASVNVLMRAASVTLEEAKHAAEMIVEGEERRRPAYPHTVQTSPATANGRTEGGTEGAATTVGADAPCGSWRGSARSAAIERSNDAPCSSSK